ncbi:MAG: hypothetical protein ACKVP7_03895 [Hyphomicrobiaceae bacterium]
MNGAIVSLVPRHSAAAPGSVADQVDLFGRTSTSAHHLEVQAKSQEAPGSGKGQASKALQRMADGIPIRRPRTNRDDGVQQRMRMDDHRVETPMMSDLFALSSTPEIGHGDTLDLAAVTIDSAPPSPAQLRQHIVTFADALAVLPALTDLPLSTRKEWDSNLRRFAKIQRMGLDEIAFDPLVMRPLLAKVMPATQRGISPKRWSNIRSSVNRTAQRMGWVLFYGSRAGPLTCPAWRSLSDQLDSTPAATNTRGFMRFCDAQRILPADLQPDTLLAYQVSRFAHTYDPCPPTTISHIRRYWNRKVKAENGWPQVQMICAVNTRVLRAPDDQFAPSLLADIKAYGQELLNPDPLADGRRRPLSPYTVRGRTEALVVAATLVGHAISPLHDIKTLADLVTPNHLKAALQARYCPDRKRFPSGAHDMAVTFYDLACRKLKLAPDDLNEIARLRNKVRPPPAVLSPRVREEVACFLDDDALLGAFFRLPKTLAAQAEADLKAGHQPKRAVLLHETALSLALLQGCPLRRRTLHLLKVEEHFRRDAKGRVIAFRIPAEITKTSTNIDNAISASTAALFHRHMTAFRPLSGLPMPSPWLFPSRSVTRPCGPDTVADRIAKAVRKALGVHFHVHLVRHLVAGMFFDDDPEGGHLASRLLHHASTKTTMKLYGYLRTRKAQERYEEVLERRLSRAERKQLKAGNTTTTATTPDHGAK